MPKHKKVHPIFNNRWFPLIDLIGGGIISWIVIFLADRLGHGDIILKYELFVFIIIAMLFAFAAQVWRLSFYGMVYGKVVIENRNILTDQVHDIYISLTADNYTKKVKPVLTKVKGEYSFKCKVPVGRGITLLANIGKKQVVTEHVGEIEGVRWLFGIPFFGLPISSGNPKHVELFIPDLSVNS